MEGDKALQNVLPVVRWITHQRNSDGGFISTQVNHNFTYVQHSIIYKLIQNSYWKFKKQLSTLQEDISV